MPLNKQALALETNPRSVQDARRWVASACRDLGRDDLRECAELGISELVTNAILHADDPLAVRLRGTRDHPRVEVFDGSMTPPAPNPKMTDDDELLSTIGRGLGIVAMCATAWGAEIRESGKIVWFEPATEISDDPDLPGDLFDLDVVLAQRLRDLRLEDGIAVTHERLPLRLYADFQRHHRELRRELRLLSLAHESDYPVAKNLSELLLRFEEELRLARGSETLEEALDSGADRKDVTLVVPSTSSTTMAQMIDLLELADAFCRSERLLSLATTPQQLQFQRWYLGEFVRQASGEAPRPWAGSEHVQSYSQSAS